MVPAMRLRLLCLALAVVGCGPGPTVTIREPDAGVTVGGGTGGGGASALGGGTGGGGQGTSGGGGGSITQTGCEGQPLGCYTVYAHGNHDLYRINLATHALEVVGPFNAPQVGNSEDTITDLAVAPDNTIWVVSNTKLYRADPTDGHVTMVAPLSNCGTATVALTTTPDGVMYAADFKGAFCRIDFTGSTPTVVNLGSLPGGYAVTGDLVAVGDGTMFASIYRLTDAANTGTQADNLVAKINPATREVIVLGSTDAGISFAGAGVNSLVAPTIN